VIATARPDAPGQRQAPRSDAMIEVFERAPDDSVTVITVRTDENGRAAGPVRHGQR
jgi:hypothetical protein